MANTVMKVAKPFKRSAVKKCWHFVDGNRVDGVHNNLSGNASGLWNDVSGLSGNVSGLWGNASGLSGDVSNLWGDVSGLSGNVSGLSGDADAIPIDARVSKPNVSDWTDEG